MEPATRQRAHKSHVVKVTGVTDELLELLDSRVKARHATGRSEYIRELLRRDLLAEPTFRQILAPVHQERSTMPDSDEDLDALFDQARDEVRSERLRSQH